MSENQPKEVELRTMLPSSGELPAPEVANFFHFTFAGPEVQLLVGYIDVRAIHDAIKNPSGDTTVRPRIAHVLVIPQSGFLHLRKQMDEIAEAYDKRTES